MSPIVRAAIKAAQNSTHTHRLGAVVHKGNRVLSWGFNTVTKSHPLSYWTEDFHTGIHAELAALTKVRRRSDLHKCEITVVRIGARGDLRMAKPCQHCFNMLVEFGLKAVHYSNQFGQITTIRIRY